jgi:hypothetical protein
MRTAPSACLLLLTLALPRLGLAQNYDTNTITVQTFAGSGFYGNWDGQGVFTMFNGPSAVVADSSSNLFVLDGGNALIRKIAPDATVTTFFNLGPYFGSYYSIGPMILDHSNALWVAGSAAYLLRIPTSGYPSQVLLPNGSSTPKGLAVDSANNLYLADAYANRIYRLNANSAWEVFAGSGNPGAVDGNWIFTSFTSPQALAFDAADNLYVWDSGNRLIRRINQRRDVTTVAGQSTGYYYPPDADGTGTNASFGLIGAMTMDAAGDLLLACGTSIRRMTPAAEATTLAGAFDQAGYTNGPGPLARFRSPAGICVAGGRVFVADRDDHRIRSLSFNATPEPVPAARLALKTFAGLEIIGIAGRAYRIESSPDFAAWSQEATVVLPSSRYQWIDYSALDSQKFYRAWLLP